MKFRDVRFWLGTDNLRLRPPASQAPPHSLPSFASETITFRHPGYPDPNNVLFRIPAHDGYYAEEPDDDDYMNNIDGHGWTGGIGIHHSTALEACRIVACNVYGSLAIKRIDPISSEDEDEDDDDDIERPDSGYLGSDDILTSFNYYYYPNSWDGMQNPDYPVCPSFDDWEFPHSEFPSEWLGVFGTKDTEASSVPPSNTLQALGRRDGTCRITSFGECTEAAHLIPENKQDWFSRNGMHQYNLSHFLPHNTITSDLQNLILLRQDLCNLFATPLFVFVPKRKNPYIHFLTPSSDYGRLYHNRKSQPIHAAPQFVYARFAWAVLQLSQVFASTPGVNIRVWSNQKREWIDTVSGVDESDVVSPGPVKKRKSAFGI